MAISTVSNFSIISLNYRYGFLSSLSIPPLAYTLFIKITKIILINIIILKSTLIKLVLKTTSNATHSLTDYQLLSF